METYLNRGIWPIHPIEMQTYFLYNEFMKAKDLKGISNPLSMAYVRILKSPAFYFIIIIFISILILNVKYPMVGDDYSYFIPRLLDSHLFYLKNGLEIQWWTPSFGAGLPSYPNPQQIQFSLPQLLLFITDPWISINISVIVFIGIGFFSTFFLFKRLSFPKDQAILGATLFSTAGFFIEHISIGHLGYITFPLLPLVILLLINDKLPIPAAAIGIAFTFFISIHTAGFYVLVIFMFSVPISLLLVYILSKTVEPNFRRLVSVALLGGVIGLLISSAKLTAVWSHLRYFPRYIEAVYDATIFKAALGFLCQLFFTPIAVFFKGIPIKNVFEYLVGSGPMGLWEFDIGLSPVVLGILLSSLLLLKKNPFSFLKNKRKVVFFLLVILLCWISFELSIAKGILYTLLKSAPFMRSLHVQVRMAAIFIFPVVITSIYIYTRLRERNRTRIRTHISLPVIKKVNLALLLSFFALMFYTVYANIPVSHGSLDFNVTQSEEDWLSIRQSPYDFEIKNNLIIRDTEVFLKRASSLALMDPLFGYRLEYFRPKVIEGTVMSNNGYSYNMTHPASLVFPEENDLSKFQRIPLSDSENFKKFVTYQNPGWKLSKIQQISNYVSIVTIIAVFLVLLFYLSRYMFIERGAAPPTQKEKGKRPRDEKKREVK